MGTESSLAAAFVKGLGSAPQEEGWEGALSKALEKALEAHPELQLDAERFARFLGEKARGTPSSRVALEALHVADLYLICGCLENDRRAMESLDRTVLAKVARVALNVEATDGFVEEVHQRLRERLLIPDKGTPRIAKYAGTGTLSAWCKVAAMRIALNLKEVPTRGEPLDPQALGVAPEATGVESKVIKHYHAEELKTAFAQAARTLTDEERVLLRYHFVDGLNFEQIAPLFQTHRSTISRRIAAARQKLLEETTSALREMLGASTKEVESLLREAHSRMEVDLTAWLKVQS
jgi:RNA polymerase sigma-70 factor, ECF subfamily